MLSPEVEGFPPSDLQGFELPGTTLYVEDFLGVKRGCFWGKQWSHGAHCIHERTLDVSRMPITSTGGVPTESFMRNSPL